MVNIIHCKNCKKWDCFEKYIGYCYKWHENTNHDDFCSYGEK